MSKYNVRAAVAAEPNNMHPWEQFIATPAKDILTETS